MTVPSLPLEGGGSCREEEPGYSAIACPYSDQCEETCFLFSLHSQNRARLSFEKLLRRCARCLLMTSYHAGSCLSPVSGLHVQECNQP